MSAQYSQIRLLSIKTVNQEQAYFFYFEGRDQLGELIDFDPYELTFETAQQQVPFEFFRDNLGKYYYRIFFKHLPSVANSLTISLRGEAISEVKLKHQEKVESLDLAKSKMRVLKYENHIYSFELELLNSRGAPVKVSDKPEFIIEGDAFLQNLSYSGEGKWIGQLRIFDTNSIIYLTPRLNSNQLPRLLRIQHIEK